VIGSIDPSGDFHNPVFLEGSELVGNEIFHEGWELRAMRQRPIVALSSEVIVADTLVRELEDGNKHFKSIVSFYPFSGVSIHKTLELDGNLEICLLVPFRDNHILAICRLHIPRSDHTEVDDVDGHWFGDREHGQVSIYAVVIHVSSRIEIERICLLDDLESHLDRDMATGGELPLRIAVAGGTVAAGIWWKGVIVTGEEVRLTHEESHGSDHAQTNSKAKKKKKKTPKKGGKKDGFARGMSLRG
jgi:hypothetical protein